MAEFPSCSGQLKRIQVTSKTLQFHRTVKLLGVDSHVARGSRCFRPSQLNDGLAGHVQAAAGAWGFRHEASQRVLAAECDAVARALAAAGKGFGFIGQPANLEQIDEGALNLQYRILGELSGVGIWIGKVKQVTVVVD